MLDKVPAQVWILVAIAAVAYTPARYVFRHVAHGPSKRDITQLPEDLDWRTNGRLIRNGALLIGLAALAVFIFTPTAARVARSASFWPIVSAALGSWAIGTVPKGLKNGRIEPLIRGVSACYERATQPKRFWASVVWNLAYGCIMLWIAHVISDQTVNRGVTAQCLDPQVKHSPQEELAACNQLLKDLDKDDEDYARFVGARGFAYHRLGDMGRAIVDYDEALRTNPEDSYAFYNRALIFDHFGELPRALADYQASLTLRPDNFDGLVRRGVLLLRIKRFSEAIDDFSRALDMRPRSPALLTYRGTAYAMVGDTARAKQDFDATRALNPMEPALQWSRMILASHGRSEGLE